MNFRPIGDLASQMLLRGYATRAGSEINTRQKELITGKSADISSRLKGDLTSLIASERRANASTVLDKSISEAQTLAEARQSVWDHLRSRATDIAAQADTASAARLPEALQAFSDAATRDFGNMVSQLNQEIAGQTLFGGSQVSGAAFRKPDEILASGLAATATAVTRLEILDAVELWLNDPAAGFDNDIYLGDQEEGRPVRVSKSSFVTVPSNGGTKGVKAFVKAAVLAEVISSRSDLSVDQKSQLAASVADEMRSASENTIEDQARLGFAQSQMVEAKVQIASEKKMAERLKKDLIGVDPFEAATYLKAAELELEKIYTVTARSSRLSLLEYLR